MERIILTQNWQTITISGASLMSFEGPTIVWFGSETPEDWGHQFYQGDKIIIPDGLAVQAKQAYSYGAGGALIVGPFEGAIG